MAHWPLSTSMLHKNKIDLTQKIPPLLLAAARYVERHLKEAGFEAYLVGGGVRSLLLGLPIKDVDITTNARPEQVQSIFKKTVPVGIEFGTIIVLYQHIPVEVTTYRHDAEYADGRRPVKVTFGETLEDDVLRRDFTVNGMAYDLEEGTVYDYVGGVEDLEARLIRTIGRPEDRFNEDGLRPVRGCRFAASLDFEFEERTLEAVFESLDTVKKIAVERFYDEWRKTLKIKKRDVFLNLLRETGILQIFFPHSEKLLSHWHDLLPVLGRAHILSMGAYAAYLLFYQYSLHRNPESFGKAQRAEVSRLLEHLKFPGREKRLALELLHSPFLPLAQGDHHLDRLKVKRLLAVVNRPWRKQHILFARSFLPADIAEQLNDLSVEILHSKEPLYISQLAIGGNDLKELNYRGTAIGDALESLLQVVLENPALNTRAALLRQLEKSG